MKPRLAICILFVLLAVQTIPAQAPSTIGYQGEEMGADGTLGQQGAFFAQEFVTAGKLELRSAVAAHEIVKAERAWEAQV